MHQTIGFSPSHLLFGKPMRLSLDQMVRYWKGKKSSNETDVVEFVQTLKAYEGRKRPSIRKEEG